LRWFVVGLIIGIRSGLPSNFPCDLSCHEVVKINHASFLSDHVDKHRHKFCC